MNEEGGGGGGEEKEENKKKRKRASSRGGCVGVHWLPRTIAHRDHVDFLPFIRSFSVEVKGERGDKTKGKKKKRRRRRRKQKINTHCTRKQNTKKLKQERVPGFLKMKLMTTGSTIASPCALILQSPKLCTAKKKQKEGKKEEEMKKKSKGRR